MLQFLEKNSFSFAIRPRGAFMKKAEKIPAEPDWDNTCAGKEVAPFVPSFVQAPATNKIEL